MFFYVSPNKDVKKHLGKTIICKLEKIWLQIHVKFRR